MRDVTAVASPIPAVAMGHMQRDPDRPGRTFIETESGPVPTAAFLAAHDIVVNCVFQDTDAPLMFVTDDELAHFPTGRLIIDVSCDQGMGFAFARSTSFDQPMFPVGDGAWYYGVDHSPTFLWNSATWTISEALIPFLRPVMEGPQAWDAERTIRSAIEIREGVVVNPKILSFQGRSHEHPHPQL